VKVVEHKEITMLELELRDYQSRIVDRTLQAIVDGHRHILIESPTGSGKTVIGHLIAQRLHQIYGYKSGWTAMRSHLLRQARDANAALLGFKEIEYFSTFDETPPGNIDVLLDDEAQHSASESSADLYNKIKPKIVIGLSATPFRVDRMKLCFSTVIRDAGIRALIDGGWLAKFHHFTFPDRWTPQNVAAIFLRDRARWGRSVMFFLTLMECYECAVLLAAGGVTCEVVHGGSDQAAQIEAFNAGRVDVLLNVIVLTEGFDAPTLKTVFVRPGSKGPTMQMTGRALRKHPDKPFAQVVQNATTAWPFTKIASAELKFVLENGDWRCRELVTEKVNAAQVNALLAISTSTATLPPQLLQMMHRKRRRLRPDPVS
jgi:superfamily II DNA or RNA helicase